MLAADRCGDLHPESLPRVVVDYVEDAQFAARSGAIVHKVHAPALVWAITGHQLKASLSPDPLATALTHLKTFFFVDPIDAFMVIHVTIPLQQDLQAPVAPTLTLLSLLTDRTAQRRVIRTCRLVAITASADLNQPAGTGYADFVVGLQIICSNPSGCGLYQFFKLMSFNMTMSSAWSATRRFRRSFSFSSSLSLLSSLTCIPL